jgi:hypothetical protein
MLRKASKSTAGATATDPVAVAARIRPRPGDMSAASAHASA